MPRQRILRSIALIVAVVLTGLKLQAQSISGSITGLVRDDTGHPARACTIIVTDPSTGIERDTSTRAGAYVADELTPGKYDVTARCLSLRPETHHEVVVDVGRVTTEDFHLVKPPPTQVFVVGSIAPPTDKTSASLNTIFSSTQIQTLPLLTRDANTLALLAPGVFSVRTFSFASTLVPFATNGARGRDNNFIIDSVDNNEPLFGGAATQFTNTDVFSDYSIITAAPKAEFGRGTGATVNVITRNGGNDIHGTAFWFGQDDLFNASDRVEQAAGLKGPAPFYENVGGATVGGPIKKDQAWFFVSYQYDDARNNLSSVYPVVATLPTDVPTATGMPSGLATLRSQTQTKALTDLLSFPSVQNPPTGSPCAINPHSSSGVINDPCTMGSATLASGTTVGFGTYLLPQGNIFDVRDQQASGRIDYKLSESQSLYGRYLIDDLQSPQSAFEAPGVAAFDDLGTLPEERNSLSQRAQSFLLDHRYYRATSVNEIRFAFTRVAQDTAPTQSPIGTSVPAATVTDTFGQFCVLPSSTDCYDGNFPAAGNTFTIGQDTSPVRTASDIYQAQENYTRVVGQHTIKFGGDLVYTQTNFSSTPADLGHYFFGSPGTQGGGLNSFVTEASNAATNALAVYQRFTNVRPVTGGLEQGPSTLELRETDIFAFVQDDFRLKPNLTLNLGLRYEAYGQPIDQFHRADPAIPYVNPDTNNFAPRVGFAWSPWTNSNTVVRGGYGISYSPMVLNIPLQMWQSGPISPFVSTLTAYQPGGLGGFVPLVSAKDMGAFPNSPLSLGALLTPVSGCSSYAEEEPTATAGASTLVPLSQCSTQDTVAPNLVNPYVQNFTLGIQHELPHQILIEVDGVGSKGTKLYQRIDLNPYQGYACDPTNPSSSCYSASATPATSDCAYSSITALPGDCLVNRKDNTHGDILEVTNGAASTYYALQTSLSKRTGPIIFTAAYTWSHMIDNASEIFGPGIQFFAGDAFDLTQDPRLDQPVEAITPLPQGFVPGTGVAPEKGNSSFDRRNRLAASYIWNIHSPQQGLPKTLLGGWQLSGITSLQSGQPFTPLNSTPDLTSDFCADGNGDGSVSNDRPYIGNPHAPLSSVALLDSCEGVTLTKSPSGYVSINPNGSLNYNVEPQSAHFVQFFGTAPTGLEQAGRNILTGPGIVDFDTALYKQFRVTEKVTAQLRWEIYDLFNTANPGFTLGNAFAAGAQSAAAYAFSPSHTAARITGVIPENAIDAPFDTFGRGGFLNESFMNTSSRRMQFGIKFIF